MDEIVSRHRKQKRDLQSVITQKQKSATKKTRKAVNEECVRLERELQGRQSAELAQINGDVDQSADHESDDPDLLTVESLVIQETNESAEVETKLPENNLPKFSDPKQEIKKPNRQKARLARRAAEQSAAIEQAEREAAELPDLRDKEQQSMKAAYSARDLTEKEIRSDGHCLYAAVADQLVHVGVDLRPPAQVDGLDSGLGGFQLTRNVAASYIDRHADEFVPFMESPLDEYVSKIRQTGEWGGHLEILALSKAYNVDTNVLHADGQVDTIGSGSGQPQATIWLSFYHHSHALGEHYNSLHRKS